MGRMKSLWQHWIAGVQKRAALLKPENMWLYHFVGWAGPSILVPCLLIVMFSPSDDVNSYATFIIPIIIFIPGMALYIYCMYIYRYKKKYIKINKSDYIVYNNANILVEANENFLIYLMYFMLIISTCFIILTATATYQIMSGNESVFSSPGKLTPKDISVLIMISFWFIASAVGLWSYYRRPRPVDDASGVSK